MNKILITLMSMLIILFTTGCKEGKIKGQVTDTNGVAIVAAQVSVISTNEEGEIVTDETVTDKKGKYSIKKLPLFQTLEITVSKEGYITHNGFTTILKKKISYDVVLEDEDDVVVTGKGTVEGLITDTTGKALVGARVFSSTSETITDAQGAYMLEVNADVNVSISADLNNHVQNSRVVSVGVDGVEQLDMTLVVVDAVETFDAGNGAEIFAKGATITLPSAYTLEDGTAYSGLVTAKVSYNRVTTLDGNKAFPGDYTGLQTDGTRTVLQSYGFIDVALTDANGSKLQIADGTTATLTYPMDTNIESTPATIPLWYYDITQGIWVEDGVATYDAATNTYSGEVTHFTTWNLDAKVARAAYESCVVDALGNPVQNATIKLTTAGWTKVRTNNDVNGVFGFINAPADLAMSVSASVNNYTSSVKTFTLTAGESRNDTSCLALDVDISTLSTKIKGNVVFENGTPVPNRYVQIRTSSNDFLTSTYTGIDGTLQTDVFLRPADRLVILTVSAYVNGQYLEIVRKILVDETSPVNDIGTIIMASTEVEGCVEMANGSALPSGLYVNVDEPYAYGNYSMYQGAFSFFLEKDFKEHTIYVNNNDNNLTASQKVVFDRTNIDLTGSCLQLEVMPVPAPITVDANITSADTKKYLSVYFEERIDYEYPNIFGERIFNGAENVVSAGTFDITKNGVYLIYQEQNGWTTFDGTISVTVNGISYTVTIPTNSSAIGEAWLGFALEVYKGEVKVIEINKGIQFGEG